MAEDDIDLAAVMHSLPARTAMLEARVVTLTNLVTFLMTEKARDFDDPEEFITNTSDLIRDTADCYDPEDKVLIGSHQATIDFADDFEERAIAQLKPADFGV